MTTTAEIETALIAALDTIRTNWHALTQATSGTGDPGAKSADTITSLDRRISLRHETNRTLNDWATVIVRDLNLTDDLPLGTDTLGLAYLIEIWARWFSGHYAAPEALDEIQTHATNIHKTVAASRAEWIHIGYCPTTDNDNLICWGDIKAWPNAEPALAPFCQRCGRVEYIDGWERAMKLGQPIPHDQILDFIRETFGRDVPRSTLRTWISRNVINASGTDSTGQALYDKGAVVYALMKKWDAA